MSHDIEGSTTASNLPADGHTNGQAHVPATVEEPIANPGLPPHQWRPTDVDPKKEKRAERQVAGFFLLSMLATVGFIVTYFTTNTSGNTSTTTVIGGVGAMNTVGGLCLAVALLSIGIGIIHYARKLMGDHEIVEMRHTASSPQEDREATLAALRAGGEESGLGRRPLVRNTMLGAVAIFGLGPLVMLRDLGPLPGNALKHTIWTKGMRVVRDVVGTPIKVADLEIGDLLNAEPEALFPTPENHYPEVDYDTEQTDKSKSAVILVRMRPEDINPKGRNPMSWGVNGILAYSKICTHVGCPISLNERTTHHLLCPCHQSTFDLSDGGRVVFGPAARPLPQLPLTVDSSGYLVAQSDFTEPVGPSFWERDSK